jgi:S-adenosylmethionine:diacylglycerol 3-amino-3-carboxypropyl transferase
MTLLFDRAFFKQLEDHFSFGKHFRSIVERAITSLPVKRNPFLNYILKGGYETSEHLPVYLQPGNFKTIRKRLDRIELVSGSCEEYFKTLPAGSVSKFNFTNIFEWMPPDSFHDLLHETIRVARQGAILTYRNLLVSRSRPAHLSLRIRPLEELSRRLHAQDLSFIYRAYVVEQITK